jgi:hypothetical protein
VRTSERENNGKRLSLKIFKIQTPIPADAIEFNLIANPLESFLRLFIATLGEDKDFYYR